MPLPATLRRLLTEYETLLAATATTPPGQGLRNVEYTLCVSTGTREITHALHKAHSYLAACSDTPAAAGGKHGHERQPSSSTRSVPCSATSPSTPAWGTRRCPARTQRRAAGSEETGHERTFRDHPSAHQTRRPPGVGRRTTRRPSP
ncbi:DUF5133 domain-containing protein [Streptomyces sp. NPDC005227]|uniref:DUF5133 domain-containing protein n=1 Tax=Streptomyces sp. NPDC005227 TaxID=3364707 RepID=UPI0036D0840D